MATWTTGGKTYNVTDEQRDALAALRSEYSELFGRELDRASGANQSHDGHHLCNASKPLKSLTADYLDKVHAILSPDQKAAEKDGARA